MVVFACNACGESLKKSCVEKHYMTKCRACEFLSCLDCGKDFYGDTYQGHTSCITEDQKYGGKSFKATPHKGAVKQNSWMEIVQEASMTPSINPKVRATLKHIVHCGHDNIPRKKAKFVNFLANSLHIQETWLIDEVWQVIDKYAALQKQTLAESTTDGDQNQIVTSTPNVDKESNGQPDTHKEKKKKRKGELKDGSGDDRGKKRRRQGDPEDEQGEMQDSVESDQPKKKKKKKRHDKEGAVGVEHGTSNGDILGHGDTSERVNADEGGKKKKKKRRAMEVNGEEIQVVGSLESQGEETRKMKKCKKRKGEKGGAGVEHGDMGDGETLAILNSDEAAKRKKKKGRAMEVNGEEIQVVGSLESPGDEVDESKKKKKCKKRKGEKGGVGVEHGDMGDGEPLERVNSIEGGKKKKKKRKVMEVNGGKLQTEDFLESQGYSVDESKKNRKETEEDEILNEPVYYTQDHEFKTIKGKFPWEAVITEVLKKSGGEITLKKLKKKVLTECISRGGEPYITSETKLAFKFYKKLSNERRFKLHKEVVTLIK